VEPVERSAGSIRIPDRDEFEFAPPLNQSRLIPAKAGIQRPNTRPKNWSPLPRYGMHTSLDMYAKAGLRLGRAVPQRSLPPCGGGTGRGVLQARCLFPMRRGQKRFSLLFVSCSARSISFVLGVLSPPPSLSLPRMGGGNRVARTFATHAMCTRVDSQRCVHALALPRGRTELRGDSYSSHLALDFNPIQSDRIKV
jgi:hypothetical protein